jgi:hypothetical protein
MWRQGKQDCASLTTTSQHKTLYQEFEPVLVLHPSDYAHRIGRGSGISHGQG